MHHPPHSPTTGAKNFFFVPIGGGRTREFQLDQQLSPILRKHGVDAVFAGHNHFYARMLPQDGIRYFVSGGGGRKTYGFEADRGYVAAGGDWYHFISVRVTPNRLHATGPSTARARSGDSGWWAKGDAADRVLPAGGTRRGELTGRTSRASARDRLRSAVRRERRRRTAAHGRAGPSNRGTSSCSRSPCSPCPPWAPRSSERGRTELRVDGDWGNDFGIQAEPAGAARTSSSSWTASTAPLAVTVRRGLRPRVGGGRAHPAALARWRMARRGDRSASTTSSAFRTAGARCYPRGRLRVEGRTPRRRAPGVDGPRGHGARLHRAGRSAKSLRAGATGGPAIAIVVRALLPTSTGAFAEAGRGAGARRCSPSRWAARSTCTRAGARRLLGPSHARRRRPTRGTARRGSWPSSGGRWRRGARSCSGKRAAGWSPASTTIPGCSCRCASGRRWTSAAWRIEGGFVEGIKDLDEHHRLRRLRRRARRSASSAATGTRPRSPRAVVEVQRHVPGHGREDEPSPRRPTAPAATPGGQRLQRSRSAGRRGARSGSCTSPARPACA